MSTSWSKAEVPKLFSLGAKLDDLNGPGSECFEDSSGLLSVCVTSGDIDVNILSVMSVCRAPPSPVP